MEEGVQAGVTAQSEEGPSGLTSPHTSTVQEVRQ